MMNIRNIDSKISLLRKSFFSISGTFFIKGINFISIPIFSRIVTAHEFGEINLFMTYMSVMTVILSFDLVGSISRGILEFNERKEEYLSSIMFLSLCILSMFVIIFLAFSDAWYTLLGLKPAIFWILVFYSYANFIISVISASLIMDYKYIQNTCICGGSALLNLFFSVILMLTIYSDNHVLGRILGASVPTIIIAGIIVFVVLVNGATFFNQTMWKFALKMSIPLIPHNISHLIFNQSDKIMIDRFFSKEQVGIYSLVANVGLMIAVLVEAMNNVWNPWMFRKMHENHVSAINQKSDLFILFFSGITIVLASVSPEIVKFLGPEQYWNGIDITLVSVYGMYFFFLYTLFVNIEFYLKKTYVISLGTVIAAIINICVNLAFMPVWGYKVAAFSTVISYVCLFLIHGIIVRYFYRLRIFSFCTMLRNALFMLLYVFLIYLGINHLFRRMVTACIFFAILLLFHRKSIKEYLSHV